ncbi:type II toxin-antitoxin system toxin DNA ADP-ribosyl transferase DarT [Trichothermofontia sp.]
MPIPLYHITHVSNLSSILRSNGLLANSHLQRLQRKSAQVQDISYENIQDRRARKLVPCGVGGVLHDYVPFYFAPRSPMLYAIHRRFTRYQGGQEPILHLVTSVEAITTAHLAFAFTDGHAVMDYSDFYDDLDDLGVIDWDVMNSNFWADTDDDPDRKRRRQEEFLVHKHLPWHLVEEIGVFSPAEQREVYQVLLNFDDRTPVKVYRDWYY